MAVVVKTTAIIENRQMLKSYHKKSRSRDVTDRTVTNKMPEGGFKIC